MGENKKKFLFGTVCGLAIGLTIVLATVLFVFPEKASAQLNVGQFGSTFGLGTTDLLSSIIKIVQWVLGFLGLIAVIMIIYGGIIWMTAAGNEEKVKKAKKIITQAVIGLIIVLLAWAIVTFVFKIINEAINPTGCTIGDTSGCNRCFGPDPGHWEYDATIPGCGGPGPTDKFRIMWQDPYPGETGVYLCQIVQVKFNGLVNKDTLNVCSTDFNNHCRIPADKAACTGGGGDCVTRAHLWRLGGKTPCSSCCSDNVECASGVCTGGDCVGNDVPGIWQVGGDDFWTASCNNGILDAGETAVLPVGECDDDPPPNRTCLPCHCKNDVKDADEIAKDCGGIDCPSCDIIEFKPDVNYFENKTYHASIDADLKELAASPRPTYEEGWDFDTGTETLNAPPTIDLYLGDGATCKTGDECASGVCTAGACVGTDVDKENTPRVIPRDFPFNQCSKDSTNDCSTPALILACESPPINGTCPKVCLNTLIEGIFSAKMRAATLNRNTIKLFKGADQVALGDITQMPQGFSTRPANTLEAGKEYRIELISVDPVPSPPPVTGIQDVCLNPLDGNYNTIKEGSEPPPSDDYMDENPSPPAPPNPDRVETPWNFYTDTDTTNVDCYPQITSVSPASGKYEDGMPPPPPPTYISIHGANFGILRKAVVFNNDVYSSNLKEECFGATRYPNVIPCLASWGESLINTAIPAGPVNNGRVIPSSGSMDGDLYVTQVFPPITQTPQNTSNRKYFDVTNPQISGMSARSYGDGGRFTGGGTGQYVTIFSRGSDGFGNTPGHVYFRSKSAPYNEVEAQYPPQPPCDAYWHNNYIVVMVPDLTQPPPVGLSIAAPYNPVNDFDANQPYVVAVQVQDTRLPDQRSNLVDFVFSTDTPTPGLCGINPSCGVEGNNITFQGTGFGASQGVGDAYLRIPPADPGTSLSPIGIWNNEQVNTNLPDLVTSNAYLGRIKHDSGEKSNELPFRVPCSGIPYVLMNSYCDIKGLPGDVYSSPSPWPDSQNNCLNLMAHARFHDGSGGFIDMNNTTLNSNNIKLYTCDAGRNCCIPAFQGDPTTEIVGTTIDAPGPYVGLEGFMLKPPANLSPGTWHKIVISKNVESNGGAKMENDFTWCYRTKDDSELCKVERVTLESTDNFLTRSAFPPPPPPDSTADLKALPFTNTCVALPPSEYQWNWSDIPSDTVIHLDLTPPNNDNTTMALAKANGVARVTAEEQESKIKGSADITVGLGNCASNPTICTDPDGDSINECPNSECDQMVDHCTPDITGLSPSTGPTGATMTVNGCWFDNYADGISKVRFGTKDVTEYPCGRYWTPNQIIVKNPLVNPPDPYATYSVYVTSAPFSLTNSDGSNQFNFISECCDKFTCNGGAHVGKECYFDDYCGTGFQCTCAHTTAVPQKSTGKCNGGTNDGKPCEVPADCPGGGTCDMYPGMPGICPPLVPSAGSIGSLVDIGPPGAEISKKSYSLFPDDTDNSYVRYYFNNEADNTKDIYDDITSAARGGHWNQHEIVKSKVSDLAISGPLKVYVDSCPSNSLNFQVRCVDNNECASECCWDTDGDTLKECVDSIYCEEGNPGDQCIYPPVSPVCDVGAPQCFYGLECLPDAMAATECRCCCDATDPNSCPAGLSCLEHDPCVNNNRGLCCGCVTDNVCGDPNNLSCGADSCCYDRPTITSVWPDESTTELCLNAGIQVDFDKNLDNGSLNNDNVIVYSQEAPESGSSGGNCSSMSCGLPDCSGCGGIGVFANINAEITYPFFFEDGEYLFYVTSRNNPGDLSSYGIYHNFDILLDGNPNPVGNIKNIASWSPEYGITSIGHVTTGNHDITVRWNNNWSYGVLDSNMWIWGVGIMKGKIYKGHFSPISQGFIFYANDVFKAETPYFVLVRGGAKGDPANVGVVFNNLGIRSSEGAYLWDIPIIAPDQSRINKLWTFTSGTDVCKLGKIKIAHIKDTGDATTDNVPDFNNEDIFDCAGANDCADDIIQDTPPTVWINDLGGDPAPAGNQHVLIAYSYDQYDNPISGVFTWTWTDSNAPKDVVGIEGAVINWNTPPTENPNDTTKAITSKPENGWETITVKAEDTDGLSPDYGKAQGDKIIRVNTCMNPWPDFRSVATRSTYTDDVANHQPNNTIAPYTNFEISYCRDQADGVLPALAYDETDMAGNEKPVVVAGSYSYGNGIDEIIKDFLLIYPDACDKSEYTNKTICENNGGKWGPLPKDAIGIRVVENEDNLSPEKWYRKLVGSAGPEPSSMTVNGYPAIKAGRTVYVAATNFETGCAPDECTGVPGNCCKGGRLYSYIYLISYTDKSTSETIEIYNRLLNNWNFNTNVTNYTDVEYIQRDLRRLLNLEDVWFAMLDYQQKNKTFPKLEAGSYLKQMSTSAWPSWEETLGAALGQDIPKDPLNNITCSDAEAEQATCWNNNKKVFHCDASPPSHIYAYQASTDGNTSNLYANLEYYDPVIPKPGTWVNFSADPCSAYAGSSCPCFNYAYYTYGSAFDHEALTVKYIGPTPPNDSPTSGTQQVKVDVNDLTGICSITHSTSCKIDADCPSGESCDHNIGVARVEFYIDNILQKTDNLIKNCNRTIDKSCNNDADCPTTPPPPETCITPDWSWYWDTTKFNNRPKTDPLTYPPYILKAIAYDTSGNFGMAVRQVYVNNTGDHVAPSIFITAPLDNSAISGLTLFRAQASDNEGLSSMDLYIDGTPFWNCLPGGAKSFTCEQNINTTSYKNGKHTLKAEATDTSGNIGRKEITVEVSNSDIKKPFVDFDHSNTFLMGSCRRSGAPVHCSDHVQNFDETGVDCGGVDCPSCNICSRAETTTDVEYYIGETNCDSADYCSAGNITGTTTVLVVASDDVGVKAVDFYLDGVFMASDPAAPYEWVFESVLVANGNHVLKARASDGVGHWADATVTVNVNNVITTNLLIAFNTPPTPPEETPPVKVSSPPSVQIQVMEVDEDGNEVTGIDRIGQKAKYILDGRPIIEIGGQSRWDWLWDTKTSWDGIHEVSVRAFDSNNIGSNTIKRSFEVHNCSTDTSLPVVNITSPADGEHINQSTGPIAVQATDAECGITKCQVRIDGWPIQEDSCGVCNPYSHSFGWNPAVCDLSGPIHSVKATCYDNKSNTGTDQITTYCDAQCTNDSDCIATGGACFVGDCISVGTGDCCNYCQDTLDCSGNQPGCARDSVAIPGIDSPEWCAHCVSCGDMYCNCNEAPGVCIDDCGCLAGQCKAIVGGVAQCFNNNDCHPDQITFRGVYCSGDGWTGSCGDGQCKCDESSANCVPDCGCPAGTCAAIGCLPSGCCANGACHPSEAGKSCNGLIGAWEGSCGDGVCKCNENSTNCCQDGGACACSGVNQCCNVAGVWSCKTPVCSNNSDCPYSPVFKMCRPPICSNPGTCNAICGFGAVDCSGDPGTVCCPSNGMCLDSGVPGACGYHNPPGWPFNPGADDGCCPPGCTSANDADCGAICGNNVIDPGEQCDPGDAVNCDGDGCSATCQLQDEACNGSCNITCTTTDPDCGCENDTPDCCGFTPPGYAVKCTSAQDPDCAAGPICGDGFCDVPGGENSTNCCQDCPCAFGTTCCNPGAGYQCLDRDANQACCPGPIYHWDLNAPTVNKCCGDDGIGDNWCSNDDNGRCAAAGGWFDNHCTDGFKDCDETGVDCGGSCVVDCCGNGICDAPEETCNTCGAPGPPPQECNCEERYGPSFHCTQCSDGKWKCRECKAGIDNCCPPGCIDPPDPDCPAATHKECQAGSCVSVAGGGADLCTTDCECKACGPADSCCPTGCSFPADPDCAHHKACSGNSCVDVAGSGSDSCTNNCPDCDTVDPTVSITIPGADSSCGSCDASCADALTENDFIRANAQDACGIDKVEFRSDGVLKDTQICAGACNNFNANWVLPNLGNGFHNVVAKAFDKAGRTKDSATRRICFYKDTSGPSTNQISGISRPDATNRTLRVFNLDNIISSTVTNEPMARVHAEDTDSNVNRVDLYDDSNGFIYSCVYPDANCIFTPDPPNKTMDIDVPWDTKIGLNGQHSIYAIAYDEFNNPSAESNHPTFEVFNFEEAYNGTDDDMANLNDLLVFDNKLYAAGGHTFAQGGIITYDGTNWSHQGLAPNTDQFLSLSTDPSFGFLTYPTIWAGGGEKIPGFTVTDGHLWAGWLDSGFVNWIHVCGINGGNPNGEVKGAIKTMAVYNNTLYLGTCDPDSNTRGEIRYYLQTSCTASYHECCSKPAPDQTIRTGDKCIHDLEVYAPSGVPYLYASIEHLGSDGIYRWNGAVWTLVNPGLGICNSKYAGDMKVWNNSIDEYLYAAFFSPGVGSYECKYDGTNWTLDSYLGDSWIAHNTASSLNVYAPLGYQQGLYVSSNSGFYTNISLGRVYAGPIYPWFYSHANFSTPWGLSGYGINNLEVYNGKLYWAGCHDCGGVNPVAEIWVTNQ